jgi:Domain of Unknown Function (DUF1080)
MKRALYFGLLCSTLGLATAQNVTLPKPDSSGWIKLFRGNNASDFYIANNGNTAPSKAQITFPNNTFAIRGDTITVTGSPAGQLYFKVPFSHYRVRYQMRFPGNTGNCGMLVHVQADDAPTQGFPRSVEAQGDPGQGMGQLWPIGDVWVTVKGKMVGGRMQYSPNDPETNYGGANWNSRVVVGVNGWGQPSYSALANANGGWVTQEVRAYGSDSVIHLVQDTARIKYRDPRVSSGGTVNNVSKFLKKGLIAWQSEGSNVWYRNLQIMLLPGDSLYTEPPTKVEFNRRKAQAQPAARKLLGSPKGIVIPFGADAKTGVDIRGRRKELTLRDYLLH